MRELRISQNSWVALVIVAMIIMSIGVAGAFFSVSLIQEIGASACTESVSGMTTIDGRVGICQGGTENQVLAKLPNGLIGWKEDATVSVTAAGVVAFDEGGDDIFESFALQRINVLGDIPTSGVFTEADDVLTIDLDDPWPMANNLSGAPFVCDATSVVVELNESGNINCATLDTGRISNGTIQEIDLNVDNEPIDEHCLTYEASGFPDFEWADCGVGLSSITYDHIDYLAARPAEDPSMVSRDTFFGISSEAHGGVVFEGDSADANEGILQVADVTADRIWDLPDVDGTLITTGDTGTVTGTMIADDSIGHEHIDYLADGPGPDENLDLGINKAWFGSWGVVFEGSQVDDLEGVLLTIDPLTAQRTWALPDAGGEIVVTGHANRVSSTMITDDQLKYLDIDYSSTLASNLALGPNESFFGSLGIIFEGSSNNTAEGLLRANNPSIDTTWVLPDNGGNLVGTGDVGSVTSAMIASNTILETDLKVVDLPMDEECLTYEATAGDFEWQNCGTGGSGSNSFETQAVPFGTNPVADGVSDTLTWTSIGATVGITGNATSDSINLEAIDVDCVGCIGTPKILDGTIIEPDLNAIDTPSDGQCLTYNAAGFNFEWQTCGSGGGGSAITLDLGDDSGDDSTDLSEIATSGDTNGIFTEPSGDKLLIDLTNNWPSADTADALSANPADCGANTKADSIAANGDLTCSAVDTGDIANDTILEIDLNALDAPADEECLTYEDTAADFEWQTCGAGGGSNSFETHDTPLGTDPVADGTSDTLTWTSTGSSLDITGTAGTDTINLDIAEDGVAVAAINDATGPSDENCLTYEETGDLFEWQACGGGGSAIILDLGDDGGNDSTDLAEIAITGDSNSIFTESSNDKLLIDASNNWPNADTADALSTDPDDCSANTKADSIAANGDLTCSAVDAGDITDNTVFFPDINYGADASGDVAMLADECYFQKLSGSGGFICEGGTANGFEQIYQLPDYDVADLIIPLITAFDVGTVTGEMIAGDTITDLDFLVADEASDEDCLTYEEDVFGLTWQPCGAGGGSNSFATMNTLTGTNPVADDSSDTLNWTSTGSTITIAGTAASDTINLEAVNVTCTDCITSAKITDDAILEVDLKAVDTPADEECLTYEATAGDFEWQTCAGGGGGSAIIFDIGDDGGNDSNDVAEIATSGDTNGIFTEPSADKILINVSNKWPASSVTDAFAANPTDCGSNLVATAIAANGNLTCSTVNTTTILNDTIGFVDIDYSLTAASNPILGANNAFFGANGILFENENNNNSEATLQPGNFTGDVTWVLPAHAGTLISTGDTDSVTSTIIANDTIDFTDIDYTGAYPASNPAMQDNEAWFTDIGIVFEGGTTDNIEGVLAPANITTTDRAWVLPDVSGTLITDGDTDTVTATMLNDTDAPGDEECLTYEATGAVFEWQTCSGGGSSNSFETMNVPAGTDPVADSATDTLNWTSTGSTITFTGTAATDTINVEAVDVTCTGCLGTTEIAGLDISADTNHTCERSLTANADGCDADAELYTDTHTIWFENPTAADDFKTIWTAVGVSYTITSISCESDQTVNFDLQIDDGTPAAVNGSSIACTTFATDSALAGDTGLDAGERLDLAIASVSGTPTWVSISWTVTKND